MSTSALAKMREEGKSKSHVKAGLCSALFSTELASLRQVPREVDLVLPPRFRRYEQAVLCGLRA